jgi:hypothetical protein
MKNSFKFVKIALLSSVLASVFVAKAGNEDRSGQSGAGELLINPWARSCGWGGANSASIKGLEAMQFNIAGLAFTKKTELLFASTNWLKGTDIKINSFGFSQRVGESGVMGMSIMSMNFGDIGITTTDLPEGGIGKFSPRFLNLAMGYAREFSNSIYGGINAKVVSESIADLKATGVAFDAGIQYITGRLDTVTKKRKTNIKFGISLKNVGPPLTYNGDGLATKVYLPVSNSTLTLEERSNKFELPTLINIGGAYDYYIVEEVHRLTAAGNFMSNSFTKDQFSLGLEYGFKTLFMVRAGYVYESKENSISTNALTGPTLGASMEYPINKNGSMIGIDYGYRFTNPFGGCHTFGARITL